LSLTYKKIYCILFLKLFKYSDIKISTSLFLELKDIILAERTNLVWIRSFWSSIDPRDPGTKETAESGPGINCDQVRLRYETSPSSQVASRHAKPKTEGAIRARARILQEAPFSEMTRRRWRRRRWRRSAGGLPFLSDLRRRGESEKNAKKNENERRHPFFICAHPHPVAAFVKTVGPVGFHSKARVTRAHLRISRRNPTLAGEQGVCDLDRSVRNRA